MPTLNQDQILGIVRALLAAGGPVAALLVQAGYPTGAVSTWLTIALVLIPPLISAVWSAASHTDASKALSASMLPGVKVEVSPLSASPDMLALAMKPTNALKVETP